MTIAAEKSSPPRFELLDPLREGPVRRLWAAQLISEIGDWASRLALAAVVFAATASPWWSALTYVTTLLPQLGLGQYLSAHAERLPRRTVLVVADLARAVVFAAAYLLAASPVALLILAFVAGVLSAPFNAVRSAAMAEMPSDRRKAATITLGSLTQDVSVLGGYLLGGILLGTVGAQLALGINAITFVVSACFLSGLPASQGSSHRAGDNLKMALKTLTSSAAIWLPAAVATVSVATATAIESLIVAGVSLAYPQVSWLAGAVLVAVAATTIALTSILKPQRRPGARNVTTTALITLMVVAGCAFIGGHGLLLAFVASAGCYVSLTMAVVTLVPALPNEHRATCMSLLAGSLVASQTALTALAGGVAAALGVSWAVVLLAALGALGAAGGLVKAVLLGRTG